VLDGIRLLQEAKTIPIQRARMRIRLTMPAKDGKRLKDKIVEKTDSVEEEDWSEEWELVRLTILGLLLWCPHLLSSLPGRLDRPGTVQSHQRATSSRTEREREVRNSQLCSCGGRRAYRIDFYLLQHPCSLSVYNISPPRAGQLAPKLLANGGTVSARHSHADCLTFGEIGGNQ